MRRTPFNPHFSGPEDVVARTLLAEAQNQGPRGMEAVAHVLKNRADAGYRHAHTMADEALSPKQFSAWNRDGSGGNVGRDVLRIPTDAPIYQQALQIARDVQSGKLQDITHGASHYYNPSVAHPVWGNQLQNVSNIGAHRFGTEKGFHIPQNGAAPVPVEAQAQQAPQQVSEQPVPVPPMRPEHFGKLTDAPLPPERPNTFAAPEGTPLPPSRPYEMQTAPTLTPEMVGAPTPTGLGMQTMYDPNVAPVMPETISLQDSMPDMSTFDFGGML